MANTFFKTTRNAIKYWYAPLIAGILFVALGMWVLYAPASSFLALSVLFSISFLFAGVSDLFLAATSRNELENWGWVLVTGIVNVVIGVLLLTNPAISIVILSFYIGFWVMFRSIMMIVTAIDLRHYGVSDWSTFLVIGILGILLSLILLANPTFAGISLVVWVGLSFILLGIFSVYVSIKLKTLHTLPGSISNDLQERYDTILQEINEAMNNKKGNV